MITGKHGINRMPKNWRLAEALAHFGAAGKNPRWSWSGRSADGRTVVINLWRDRIRRDINGQWLYDEFDRTDLEDPYRLSDWTQRPGNRERLENLIWARDHCEGHFRVIVIVAKDTGADPREIADCYPQDKLQMRITELDEQTGRFRAVQGTE
jgi:hypothetical protein